MKSQILFLHEQLVSKKTTPQQLIDKCKALADQFSFTNSIVTPIFQCDDKFDENNILSGIPYSLKDNISTKGIRTTGGSKFLINYIPPFDATVYQLLKNAGCTLIAKDAMDEFGLGGSGVHCAVTGKVCNPFDRTKISGGSSSGSAVNVATGISTFAIGTDTGDSVRRPAALNGIVGYKPTYGAISRYGVFPYAPSFDHVGILAKYVTDVAIVASKIIQYDEKDYTSTNMIKNINHDNLKSLKQIRFVVIKNLLNMLSKEQKELFTSLLNKLKKDGHFIAEVDFDTKLLESMSFAYQVLTYSEGYSCYSNLQAITFGKDESSSNDDYFNSLNKSRTMGIGSEVKRRFVIGAYLTSRENYQKISLAARVCRHLVQDAEIELLKHGDCILMPSTEKVAFDINNPQNTSLYDNWLMISNFSGTPSITIPFTKVNGLPWGLTISADVYQDTKLLNIAYTLENVIGGEHE